MLDLVPQIDANMEEHSETATGNGGRRRSKTHTIAMEKRTPQTALGKAILDKPIPTVKRLVRY